MVPPLSSHLTYRWYPRSRGVYGWGPSSPRRACGSSPLARGLPPTALATASALRIIPARAGFTGVVGVDGGGVQDHPRSRGVYPPPASPASSSRGSSPLTRGLPPTALATASALRIIPARAGFTHVPDHRPLRRPDHPRSRGVYTTRTSPPRPAAGSSPLARGLLAGPASGGPPGGIIPARAGFTLRTCPAPSTATDHPRSRGVYLDEVDASALCTGSSPLARGLHHRQIEARKWRWIIPARAGFTTGPGQARGSERDHPRSRGVYSGRSRCSPTAPGSSPLARGLLTPVRAGYVAAGIIPARAGFT